MTLLILKSLEGHVLACFDNLIAVMRKDAFHIAHPLHTQSVPIY